MIKNNTGYPDKLLNINIKYVINYILVSFNAGYFKFHNVKKNIVKVNIF